MKDFKNGIATEESYPMQDTQSSDAQSKQTPSEDSITQMSDPKVPKSHKSQCKRVCCYMVLVALLAAIFAAIALPTYIFATITHRMDDDFESINNFTLHLQSQVFDLQVQDLKVQGELEDLRQQMRSNRRFAGPFSSSSGSNAQDPCPPMDFSAVDVALAAGSDAERRIAFNQLVVHDQDECFANNSEYLYRLAAAYFYLVRCPPPGNFYIKLYFHLIISN